MAPFSPDEIRRYSRHFLLHEFGKQSQEKLKAARVLCIGAGGLGSPAATYLAAAGIGTLGLVDFDQVDLSNLQRQILHSTADVGRAKVDSARDRLSALNPEVKIETHAVQLDRSNAMELFANYDVILDGTDNYATRYLINDACVLLGKPNVSASVFRFEGQLTILSASGGPCYRCLYPSPPPPGLVPSCGEGGVLGVVPGIMGTLQASETIKLVAGIGEPLIGRLLFLDALEMESRILKIRRDPGCLICGEKPTIRELTDYESFCNPIPAQATGVREIGARALKERLDKRRADRRTADRSDNFVLLDVRDDEERQICKIEPSVFIPLSELSSRVAELDPGRELIVYCKGGKRSAKAAELLQGLGFGRVSSLRGGICAWIDEVDGSLQKY